MTVLLLAIYTVIVASAAGCLHGILRESQGRPVRLWRLFATPLLALATALVLLLLPATELKDLWLWAMAFGIGSVLGVLRGFFIAFQVDHQWHLIRMIYARVASVVAVVLAAVGALEIAASIAAPNGSPLHPILAAGGAGCAAFLIGRATTVGMRARRESHHELHA